MLKKKEHWDVIETRVTTFPTMMSRQLISSATHTATSKVSDFGEECSSFREASKVLHEYVDHVQKLADDIYEGSSIIEGKIVRVVDTDELVVLVSRESGLFSNVLVTQTFAIKKVS
jgi:hypothetical protein